MAALAASAAAAGAALAAQRSVWLCGSEAAVRAGAGSVVYWMFRDKRAADNHALLAAARLATESGCALQVVLVVPPPKYMEWTLRHYHFLVRGLRETHAALAAKHIALHVWVPPPSESVAVSVLAKARALGARALVLDFLPLRDKLEWDEWLVTQLQGSVPVLRVDAHNVVPCWVASDKYEYGARTIRPKIESRLGAFLVPLPELATMPPGSHSAAPAPDPDALLAQLKQQGMDASVGAVDEFFPPGEAAALAALRRFIEPLEPLALL
jgi:deoxyribodipyrimidine photo-lyase